MIGTLNLAVIVCAVIAGVVIYKQEKDRNWIELVKNNAPFIILLVCMIIAVISAVIGLFLCCCKKKCLNITYLIIIIIVIVVEVVGVVLAFIYKDKIIDGIADSWVDEKLNKTRIEIERAFECCGFDENHTDETGVCGFENRTADTPYCYDQIVDEINSNMKSLKIGIIVMVVLEVVLFICASCVACGNSDEEGIAKF
ncbi:Tetraspanin family protein [Tritrichomonas foetus]|uniref:Tetraspanin family protein n=1 Tax=Tritrichomonas foetus TaxID=1144522 RepID=A0A1J4K159_9EUKA|nr:Tetraspanin family protein [Tritrichomonas foetus]|eukprot:OHT04971.1 Tetraspanin family protein [Tritrichomonas foetus]